MTQQATAQEPNALRGMEMLLANGQGCKADILVYVLLSAFEALTTEFMKYDERFEKALKTLMTTLADHLAEPMEFQHSTKITARREQIELVKAAAPEQYQNLLHWQLYSVVDQFARIGALSSANGEFIALYIRHLRMFAEEFKVKT